MHIEDASAPKSPNALAGSLNANKNRNIGFGDMMNKSPLGMALSSGDKLAGASLKLPMIGTKKMSVS